MISERDRRVANREATFADRVVGIGIFAKEVVLGSVQLTRHLPSILFETRNPRKVIETTRTLALLNVLLEAQKYNPTLCTGRIEYLMGITDTDPHPSPKLPSK
jgi:hypothetical protein